jgi:hypothetical protein
MVTARVAGLLLLLLTPVAAVSAPITYEFSGTIGFTFDSSNVDPVVPVGTAFSGTFDLDADVPASFVGTDFANYLGLFTNVRIFVGDLVFTQSSGAVGPFSPQNNEGQVSNDRPGDGRDGLFLGAALNGLPTDPSNPLFYRYVSFGGVGDNVFSGLVMPQPPIDLALFNVVPFSMAIQYSQYSETFGIVSSGQLFGNLARLQPVSVPEPGSLLLIATGLFATGLARVRRSRS